MKRHMLPVRLGSLALVVACVSLGAACGGGSGSGDSAGTGSPANVSEDGGKPQPGGSVTLQLNAGWDTLDPARTAFAFARIIMGFIYDPLLTYDKDGKVVPGLAKSYDVSDDGKTVTLELPPGIKFQDGTPCDAEAVVLSLERIQDPDLKSPLAASISGPVDSIEATTPTTVVIHMKRPFAPFIDSLTQVSLAPVSPTAIKKHGDDFGAHPVGTGPFTFDSQVPNDHIVLKRNPDYQWAPATAGHQGPAYLDQVTIRNIPEPATAMALLQSGDVDLLYSPIGTQIPALKKNPEFQVFEAPQTGVPQTMIFNVRKFPFDNLAVRQAVSHAIDKEQILKTAFNSIGTIADNVLAKTMFGYSAAAAAEFPTQDPEKAKQILTDDGWTAGSDGILVKDGKKLEFEYLVIANNQQNQLLSQVIQSNLKDIGIAVKIVQEEQGAFVGDQQQGKFPFVGILFPATDPDIMYTILATDSIGKAWNAAGYTNEEMDRLLAQGRETIDPDKRLPIYENAQRLVARDLPYLPIWNVTRAYAATARLQGLRFDQQAFWNLYDAWVEP